jgi:dolichyl-phosphate beta-glucosyltransferase
MTLAKIKPYLSVVIPAYNEHGRRGILLKNNVCEIGKYLKERGIPHEVIIVNDGSNDDTGVVSKTYSSFVDALMVIDRKENKGKWYSVCEGLLLASGKFRMFTDADGATPIRELEKFLEYMKNDENIIIGSRGMKESKIEKHQPKWKEVLGVSGNILIQSMMGLHGIKDTQCGFKVFSGEAVKKIIPQMKTTRFGGDFEMLMLAKKMGYQIIEVPIVWIDSGQSLVTAKEYINTFKELFQVRSQMVLGKYTYK